MGRPAVSKWWLGLSVSFATRQRAQTAVRHCSCCRGSAGLAQLSPTVLGSAVWLGPNSGLGLPGALYQRQLHPASLLPLSGPVGQPGLVLVTMVGSQKASWGPGSGLAQYDICLSQWPKQLRWLSTVSRGKINHPPQWVDPAQAQRGHSGPWGLYLSGHDNINTLVHMFNVFTFL